MFHDEPEQRKAPARRVAGAKVSHVHEVMEHLAPLFRPNTREESIHEAEQNGRLIGGFITPRTRSAGTGSSGGRF
jgi:hypothetical protein